MREPGDGCPSWEEDKVGIKKRVQDKEHIGRDQEETEVKEDRDEVRQGQVKAVEMRRDKGGVGWGSEGEEKRNRGKL